MDSPPNPPKMTFTTLPTNPFASPATSWCPGLGIPAPTEYNRNKFYLCRCTDCHYIARHSGRSSQTSTRLCAESPDGTNCAKFEFKAYTHVILCWSCGYHSSFGSPICYAGFLGSCGAEFGGSEIIAWKECGRDGIIGAPVNLDDVILAMKRKNRVPQDEEEEYFARILMTTSVRAASSVSRQLRGARFMGRAARVRSGGNSVR